MQWLFVLALRVGALSSFLANSMTEVEEHNAALEKVTDFVEEKELNEDETKELSTALSSLADPVKALLPRVDSR